MGASGRRRGLALLSGGLAAGMLLAACGGSADSASESADQATAPGETSVDEPGGGTNAGTDVAPDCAAYVEYLGNEGSTVEILSSTLFAEDQLFDEAWAGFEECTGIDIVHEPTETFEADLSARVAAGDAPDIAWVSGPRELSRLVDAGGLHWACHRRHRPECALVLRGTLEARKGKGKGEDSALTLERAQRVVLTVL